MAEAKKVENGHKNNDNSNINSIAGRFKEVIKESRAEYFDIVLTHIDPDSLGAAFGLQAAIESIIEEGSKVRIYADAVFANAQNRTIANIYDLERKIIPLDEYKNEDNSRLVLVDSSKLFDSRVTALEGMQPLIIIDHHRENNNDVLGEEKNMFYWVEDVGATSTLVFELAQAVGVDFGDEKNGFVATLLAMGIRTDTKSLLHCTKRDVYAYGQLLEHLNSQELRQLVRYTLPPRYYDNLEYALRTRKQRGPRIVTGIGVIPSEEADDVATIADYLLRIEGGSLVVVWAIIKDSKQVRIAARCSDPSVNLNAFLKKRFGNDSAGSKFTPGGHGEGGALITLNLGPLMIEGSEEVRAKVEDMVQTSIRELVFLD
ncbi:hypothetical protein D6821_01850 [Candidatus Parcubacteria bacterium]|nr:MAG: hypothetical protein D6821_01850 [Candidatus Parcubacteria bacterium]